jgi:hypothetical protein
MKADHIKRVYCHSVPCSAVSCCALLGGSSSSQAGTHVLTRELHTLTVLSPETLAPCVCLSIAICPQAPAEEPAAERDVKQRQHPPPQLYYGQLYGAFMKMTLSPLHQDAASSCAVSGGIYLC